MKSIVKYLCLIMILISMMLFGACSGARYDKETEGNAANVSESPDATKNPDKETDNPSEKPLESPDASPEPEATGGESPSSIQPGIKSFTMDEAGLNPIPVNDFSNLSIDPRILKLVDDPSAFELEDYTRGLTPYRSILIVDSWFKDSIIGNIKIGSSMQAIKQTLGKPSYEEGDECVYKTRDYYVVFSGETLQFAAFYKTPVKNYDVGILLHIIEELNGDSYSSLQESLDKLDPDRTFFDEQGFINGGGYYAYSHYGIRITQFDENTVEVFNNFEGRLYGQESLTALYSQSFVDLDSAYIKVNETFGRYKEITSLLDTDSVLSPNGKLKAAYEWLYSMDQHFIIRTLDHSQQDRYIYVPIQNDYYWLNDSYLLYTSFADGFPYAVDINVTDGERFNVLELSGALPVGTSNDSILDFNIVKVEKGVITVKDDETNQQYAVKYAVDGSGKITFSLQK